MKNDEYQREVTLRNIYKKNHYYTHIKLDLPLHRKIPEDIQCMRKKKTNKKKPALYCVCNQAVSILPVRIYNNTNKRPK